MSDTEKSNGGNGNKQLVTWVTGAILTTALTTWAASGKSAQSLAQEAKDKAAAVDMKLDGSNALIQFRLQAIEAAQKEQSETLKAMWRLLDDERRKQRAETAR